jgi:phosphohistidine phosphatase SixA
VRRILFSPYTRAVQTADAMARILGENTTRPVATLSAGAPIGAYRDAIRAEKDNGPLLLIGHMPEIAMAASHLTGVASLFETGLKPADILAVESGPIEKDWGKGRILWQKRIEEWR